MAKVIDYDYIVEVSTADALKQSASDITSGYNGEIPGVNTYKINAETSIYNEQGGGGGTGIAGWSTNVSWSASDYNTVAWSSGNINLPDGTTLTVTAGNTGNMSSTTYIYYDRDDNTVKYTTNSADSVGEKKILICVAAPTTYGKDAEFQAFGCGDQSTFIHADQIAANTITGNEIAANTITAYELDVDYLSAISADLGSITAGDITGTTITAGSTSSNGIKLYPYSSSQGRIAFYYNGSQIGYLQGQYSSGVGSGVVMLNGNYIVLDGDAYMLGRDTLDLSSGKLRIPVGSDLY